MMTMKQRKYLLLGVGLLFLLVYYRTASAQTKPMRLEDGSLRWEKNDFCFSVQQRDGQLLPAGSYVGTLVDFGYDAAGEVHFEVDTNGVLNGTFTVVVQDGAEVTKATMKDGCYDGCFMHYIGGEVVAENHIKDRKLVKAVEYFETGKSVTTFDYEGEKFTGKQTYPDGSWLAVSGVGTTTQVIQHYNADSVMVRYVDQVTNEEKKWNNDGQLLFHSYEENVDEHTLKRVEETYENGVISKTYSTLEVADQSAKVDGDREKTYIYYYPNGNIKEEYVLRPALEKTGEDFRITRQYNANGDLTEVRTGHFDQAKGVEVEIITYYENGQVVGEDQFEVETVAPLPDEGGE